MCRPSQIETAVARLDAWLETMRGPDGYGGPVVHWWQQKFLYTGVGADWRYEGIIAGYLELWRRTRDGRWLAKACRAGRDVVDRQLDNGQYAASAFEMNPAAGGTPHEAACDVGLLSLAGALREAGDATWERYAACAARNVDALYIGQLWDVDSRSFRDDPRVASFVPNKAATACEALFLLAELTATARWIDCYALPTLDRVVAHQVQQKGSSLHGAIAQSTLGRRTIEKYFPLYIGRCVPPLLRAYRWTNDERYASCAFDAMRFVARWAREGGFPTVVYPDQRVNRYPSWIAALGDILRATEEVRGYGIDIDFREAEQRLLGAQDASGGIATASGFAAHAGGRCSSTPDVRDLLHVVGWCDKAFRYLASRVRSPLPTAESTRIEVACTFRGQAMRLTETPELLDISGHAGTRYRWHKGDPWPAVASPEFWLQ